MLLAGAGTLASHSYSLRLATCFTRQTSLLASCASSLPALANWLACSVLDGDGEDERSTGTDVFELWGRTQFETFCAPHVVSV